MDECVHLRSGCSQFHSFSSLSSAIYLGQTLCDLNGQKCGLNGIVQGDGCPVCLEAEIHHMHTVSFPYPHLKKYHAFIMQQYLKVP